ncbi:MAG: SpoVG family protein [Pirellulaceae bacterium]
MIITDVRIKTLNQSNERLLAYCDITIDDVFVVRDLRLIQGDNGYIVAMPSRKASSNCNACGYRNQYDAKFCCQCGKKMLAINASSARHHYDVAHPINVDCRKMIEDAVIAAYTDQDAT